MKRIGRAIVIGVVVVWTLPITGLIVTALRPVDQTATSGWWTAATDPQFTLDNVREVLGGAGTAPGMFESFVASLAIAVPATVLLVVIAAVAAYALAWGPMKGRDWLLAGAVLLVFVPVQVALIPLVAAYDETGLRGTWPGLWLAHVAFGLPLAVLLLRGAMAQVPADLIDAARTEGASHLDTMRRVVLPLVVPALAGVAVLQFLLVWNDFLVAATLLGEPEAGTAPLPLAVAELVSIRPQEHHLLSAATLVTVIVPLGVYAALHRLVISAARSTVLR